MNANTMADALFVVTKKHNRRECLFQQAFGENGTEIPTSFSAAFPKSSEVYREIMATSRVDSESLKRQDEKLSMKLLSKCSIPLVNLTDADISPATKALIFMSRATPNQASRASPANSDSSQGIDGHVDERQREDMTGGGVPYRERERSKTP